jgi:hypothetical protein
MVQPTKNSYHLMLINVGDRLFVDPIEEFEKRNPVHMLSVS